MTRVTRTSLLAGALAGAMVLSFGCTPEAHGDATVPCQHDRECTTGLSCLPGKNGITNACLSPACSKQCTSDDDCKGFRKSTTNEECLVCREVGECPHASVTSEAGPLKACIDRCEAVPQK